MALKLTKMTAVNEEHDCVGCGTSLRRGFGTSGPRATRGRTHYWADAIGDYCTKRCAETHHEQMDALNKRWTETPPRTIESFNVTATPDGYILTLNGTSYALGTYRAALVNALTPPEAD